MIIRSVFQSVERAWISIVAVALTYTISVIIGIIMVHSGNQFSLNYMDDLVGRATTTDQAAIALQKGDRLKAAALDFSSNLTLGAVPTTVMGMSIVLPFPFIIFRGWVGGIVSVWGDKNNTSRLSQPSEAVYYLLTLVLQLIPYSLSGGAGINLGLAAFRPRFFYQGKKWFGFPKEAVLDVFRIYILVIPLFFVASLWEFLAR